MSVQTEDAQITSTAVEIDTLRVSGRQLTLRTFRQLQRAPVIDPETHDLQEPIWGWVNYFWDDNQGDLHAVWQKGNELRRSPIRFFDREARSYIKVLDYDVQVRSYPSLPTDKLSRLHYHLKRLTEELDTHGVLDPEEIRDLAEKEVFSSDEFNEFEQAINEYRERVRAVEGEGQLFIAT